MSTILHDDPVAAAIARGDDPCLARFRLSTHTLDCRTTGATGHRPSDDPAHHVDDTAAGWVRAGMRCLQPTGYPAGWPAKHRPTLDALRAMLADPVTGTPLRHGTWTWFRKGGTGPDGHLPPGAVLVRLDDGGDHEFRTVDELAAWLQAAGLLEPPARPARRPARPKVTVDDVAYPSTVDARRARRDPAPTPEVHTVPAPDPAVPAPTVGLPVVVVEYLARLVYADKRDYAAAYAAHVFAGGPCPPDPGTGWAGKARAAVDRLARKAA